jgi:cytochrome c oxidase assembly protein subunit 15
MAVADTLIRPPASDASTALPARAEGLAARLYFLLLAALGLAALVLNVSDRWTPDLFPVAPPVDLVPPLDEHAWYAAFVQHQQDPIFAACGGAESLAQFKLLYWWEWLRRGSVLLLGGVLAAGLPVVAALPGSRSALRRLAGLACIGIGYLMAARLLDFAAAHVDDLARYNVGQYRHALEVSFASLALAFALSAAITPRDLARPRRAGWVFSGLIVLDIAAGALFTGRDAGAVWRDVPGYAGSAFPPIDRLVAYAPIWLNFTFNQYMIQLVHRMLSIGIWIALAVNAVGTPSGRKARRLAWGLFALATAETAGGVASLWLGASATAAFVHELGAVALLATAIVSFASVQEKAF